MIQSQNIHFILDIRNTQNKAEYKKRFSSEVYVEIPVQVIH